MAGLDPARSFVPLSIAVLTVSDTRSLAEDRSGDVLVERLAKAGHRLGDRALVTDDIAAIQAKVRGWIADPEVRNRILSRNPAQLYGFDSDVA